MTAEDDLRVLLRTAADAVVPAGDGLSLIRQRIARKRRLRVFALPATGALALGIAAALFLNGGGGADKLVVAPLGPSATPSAETSSTPGPATPYAGQALFDFFSSNKDEVVRRWLVQVGVQGAPENHTCESCDVVGIAVAGKHVGNAVLSRSFADGGIVYHLVGVTAAGMDITAPKDGEAITSPTTVTGTLDQGVDESVLLRLVSQQGAPLGQTSAPAGSAAPWSAQLSWHSTDWSSGVLVATTASAKDGAVTRLAAVPVNRASAPTSAVAAAACGRTSLEVGLIDDPGGHYTGDSSVVITLHNVGTDACSLKGYAQLLFRAADGSVLPFDLQHGSGQAFRDPGALPITLAPGSTAAIGVTKYRCDLAGGIATSSLSISFPSFSTTLRGLDRSGTVGVAFCGAGDPGVQLHETAVVGSVDALFR